MKQIFAIVCLLTIGAWSSSSAAENQGTTAPAITGAAMTPVVRNPAPPPQPVHNVRDFGAKGDGTTNDTEALRKAIAACAGSGGSVLLDKGVFRSANLELKSRMTLYVAEGATLMASDKPSDFPVVLPARTKGTAAYTCHRSLLFADGANNLTIDGGGTIDGNGRGLHKNGMVGTKPEATRPSILRVFNGTNITVRNVRFHDPHMWTQVYDHCHSLLVERVLMRATAEEQSYNTDGMDICDCRHVIVRDNDIECGDDSICLKSHDADGGLEDVLITGNTINNLGANGIKLGTATTGFVRNIRILNNRVKRANLGGLCIESVDGAAVSDITVKGLTLEDCMHPIFIRLGARGGDRLGSIDRVFIEDVVITPTKRGKTGEKWGNGWTEPSCTITGITRKNLGNIHFRNIRIVMPGGVTSPVGDPPERDKDYPQSSIFGRIPAAIFFVRHADKVSFENIEVGTAKPDTRPWLRTVNAKVEQNGVKELGVVGVAN